MSVTEHSIKVESLRWFYREANPRGVEQPSPVLLLHGIPSQSYSWSDVMSNLAERGFRAIAPDWIGSGSSAKPDRREFAYTPEAYIDALAGFISALEMENFSLVVQGFLGSVGLQYAFRYPDQIECLAILNTPLSSAAKLPWKMRQWGIPLAGEMLTQDPLLVDRTLEGGSGYQISDRDLDVYRQPFLKSSDAGRSLLATIKNLELSQSMAELEMGWRDWKKPTLIIWGMEDPWLPFSEAENLASSPNVELVKLEEAKHYPQKHWSQEVGDALTHFLRRTRW
ncbi:MAG: hydrolase [Cyanobacteria bacterium QS_4_48_99]|nr:MAG: hydrolase [Cyanobacteria bacterium QS_4_48_99]